MTDITKLTVSLTKHGAYKVASLLMQLSPDDVLASTSGKIPGINIDRAQARKNLSVQANGVVPALWSKAKLLGTEAVNRMVMLGIIFSHHEVIAAFQNGATGAGRGRIERETFDDIKAFTNLKNDLAELGFAVDDSAQQVQYNLSPIFQDARLSLLARELFRLKLLSAGWDATNDVVEESIRQGFHRALSCDEATMRRWLNATTDEAQSDVDELPERIDPPAEVNFKFSFRPGHIGRQEGEVKKNGSGKTSRARLIHNALQTKLYNELVRLHGADNVGTELPVGEDNTCIDVARKTASGLVFYEIKTSVSLKKCIREALPQLVEYACWPSENRADEWIIVSSNKATKDAQAYLKLLRDKFKLPIFHETIDPATGSLSGRI